MRYVGTGGATGDAAARRLSGLRTCMVRDEVRFDPDWELQSGPSAKWSCKANVG